jgi:proton-translocating NADH-quinone oxidoreductase chain L
MRFEPLFFIVIAPLVNFLLLCCCGRHIGIRGAQFNSALWIGLAWVFTMFYVGRSSSLTFCTLNERDLGLTGFHHLLSERSVSYDISIVNLHRELGYEGAIHVVPVYTWIESGLMTASQLWVLDSLSLTMFTLIITISFVVHIYSFDYMSHDPHQIRFLSYLSLFTFFMLILVVSNNFIGLFMGWEGVGICSYLLISFWYTRLAANKAAVKAILYNRIGDCGLLAAIGLIYFFCQSVDYATVFSIMPYYEFSTRDLASSLVHYVSSVGGLIYTAKGTQSVSTGADTVLLSPTSLWLDVQLLDIIVFCLFLGAMGKSAQFFLHVWLTDAMEGPTPVSALIHAATMVTAGVYLLIRCSYLLEHCRNVNIVIATVSMFTIFFASTSGITQLDIKKAIAYSTCSQLGYMVLICAFSHYHIAIFHLFNHGWFKALLFLSAGLIIHSNSDEQGVQFTGPNNCEPLVYCFFFIGTLASIGFPYLTGFYSKDLLIELLYVTPYGILYGYLCSLCIVLATMYSLGALADFLAITTEEEYTTPGTSESSVSGSTTLKWYHKVSIIDTITPSYSLSVKTHTRLTQGTHTTYANTLYNAVTAYPLPQGRAHCSNAPRYTWCREHNTGQLLPFFGGRTPLVCTHQVYWMSNTLYPETVVAHEPVLRTTWQCTHPVDWKSNTRYSVGWLRSLLRKLREQVYRLASAASRIVSSEKGQPKVSLIGRSLAQLPKPGIRRKRAVWMHSHARAEATQELAGTWLNIPTIVIILLSCLTLASVFIGYVGKDLFSGTGSNYFLSSIYIKTTADSASHLTHIVYLEALMPFKYISLIYIVLGVLFSFGIHKLSNNLVASNYISYVATLFFYKGWLVDYVYGFVGRRVMSLAFDFFILDKKHIEQLGPLAISTLTAQVSSWSAGWIERPVLTSHRTRPGASTPSLAISALKSGVRTSKGISGRSLHALSTTPRSLHCTYAVGQLTVHYLQTRDSSDCNVVLAPVMWTQTTDVHAPTLGKRNGGYSSYSNDARPKGARSAGWRASSRTFVRTFGDQHKPNVVGNRHLHSKRNMRPYNYLTPTDREYFIYLIGVLILIGCLVFGVNL